MTKIVICGGHLTPAEALIEELINKKSIQLIFIGRKYSTEGSKSLSAEYIAISKSNIRFYKINAGRLQRKFTWYTIPALLKIPIGFAQSLSYLVFIKPKLVVSFGGYVSLPVVFCAWLVGARIFIHEQSSVPGLANKISAVFAEKIFLAWPQAQKYFPKRKTNVIGNLTRKSIFKKAAEDEEMENFLQKPNKKLVILGGNQGSHFINSLIFKILPKLSKFSVFHQVGTANYKSDFDKAKLIKAENYFATNYIDSKNIGAVLSKSDLIISRAGANTVWEISILAKPAILIPLPFAGANEQQANAEILKKSGCVVLDQDSLTSEKLFEAITKSFDKLGKLKHASEQFRRSLPKDANSTFTKHLLSYT